MPSDILFFHNLITFDCTLRISINAGYFIRYLPVKIPLPAWNRRANT